MASNLTSMSYTGPTQATDLGFSETSLPNFSSFRNSQLLEIALSALDPSDERRAKLEAALKILRLDHPSSTPPAAYIMPAETSDFLEKNPEILRTGIALLKWSKLEATKEKINLIVRCYRRPGEIETIRTPHELLEEVKKYVHVSLLYDRVQNFRREMGKPPIKIVFANLKELEARQIGLGSIITEAAMVNWSVSGDEIILRSELKDGQKVLALLFELGNALKESKTEKVNKRAREGSIPDTLETPARVYYAKLMERIECETADLTDDVITKTVADGTWSRALLERRYNFGDFEDAWEHMLAAGHAQKYMEQYDRLRAAVEEENKTRGEPKPSTGP